MVGLSEQIKVFETARQKYAERGVNGPPYRYISDECGNPVCAATALLEADEIKYSACIITMATLLNLSDIDGLHGIPSWNDSSTKEEVLAGFDQVISELKAKYALETTRELHDDVRTEVAIEV